MSPSNAPTSPIVAHLYETFLAGETCDVSLVCVSAPRHAPLPGKAGARLGGWKATYLLHRVVVTQAGFFRSLFTSGFRESRRAYSDLTAQSVSEDSSRNPERTPNGLVELMVHFDDPNITRAAFEICLARLYGGGPDLYLAPEFHATLAHPLTRTFPFLPSMSPPPNNAHPATPKLLLSLIATSVYLAMPTNVAAEALGLVMQSVGPRTIMPYLRFALGEGLNGISNVQEDEKCSAVGLEGVARHVDDNYWESMPEDFPSKTANLRVPSSASSVDGRTSSSSSSSTTADFEVIEKLQGMSWSDEDEESSLHTLRAQALRVSELKVEHDDIDDVNYPTGKAHQYYYGAVSNQIGETCACWLARWGVDLLAYEEARFIASTSSPAHRANHDISGMRPAPFDASSRTFQFELRRKDLPVVWGLGGLSINWIRGLIASDMFFIPNELERYRFAVRVRRLRKMMKLAERNLPGDENERKRKPSIIASDNEVDKKEWDELFRTAIYYSHMSLEELRGLEQDGFVPMEIITQAHWAHSIFRNTVTSARASTGLSPPLSGLSASLGASTPTTPPLSLSASPGPQRELNITCTTAQIRALMESEPSRASRTLYFPVFTDSSERRGDYLASPSSMPQVPDYSTSSLFLSETSRSALGGDGKVHAGRLPANESALFGLRNSRRTAQMVLDEDLTGRARWTEFEPFRFSAEWWGAEALKEKSRLHSPTLSYAGSWYNVYVQVTRKKGLQLGLYLHRQSMVDPIPVPSSPPGSRERSASSSSITALPPTPGIHAPRAMRHGLGGEPVQISTRVSHFTGAVSSSPPTPTAALNQLPTVPRIGSPLSPSPSLTVLPTVTSGASASTSGSLISTTYTTYYRTVSPAVPGTGPSSYRDPRPVVRAYFSIAVPSATGSSMAVFRSGVDDFSIDGSWGWRSGTCLEIPQPQREETKGITSSADLELQQWLRGLSSVRAMLVIGVV